MDTNGTVSYTHLGGSDLGPRAMYLALENWAKKNNTFKMEAKFISNVDPDDAAAVSYTHLDVYKRQILIGAIAIGLIAGMPFEEIVTAVDDGIGNTLKGIRCV